MFTQKNWVNTTHSWVNDEKNNFQQNCRIHYWKSLKKHSDCMYWVSCFISANRYITWASQKEAFRPKLSKHSITISWKVTFVHEVKHTQGL